MKRITLTVILCLGVIVLLSNPVYEPEFYLHRFSFDEDNKWEIQLYDFYPPDSIMISSSTGQSLCIRDSFSWGEELVITNDSLLSPVTINPDGDSVSILSYGENWGGMYDTLMETFVFGNYPNATIPKPLKGQSIVRILRDIMGTSYHCLCDSHGNTRGTLHGNIYDKNNVPIESGYFNISPFPIHRSCGILWDYYDVDGFDINSHGEFSISLYSIKYDINNISACTKDHPHPECTDYTITGTAPIDPLYFELYPGASLEKDIHLLDDITQLENVKTSSAKEVLEIYPNPVNIGFHYSLCLPVKSTDCALDLIDSGGQVKWRIDISEPEGEIVLPLNISEGFYFLRLWINGKSYSSQKIVISK